MKIAKHKLAIYSINHCMYLIYITICLSHKNPMKQVISFLILQMGEMRLREGESLAQGHTASEWQSWDSVSGIWILFPHHNYSAYPAAHERGNFLHGDPFTPTQGNEVPQNSNCSGGPTRRKLPRQLMTLIPFFWNNHNPQD